MTSDTALPEGLAPGALHASDGRPMIGHVILRRGEGHDGVDSLAIWHVATDGARTGAWIVPRSEAFHEPTAARRILSTCLQRSILGWDLGALPILHALERIAGVRSASWEATAICLPQVLAEIVDVRAAYGKRVAEQQRANANIAPLEWTVAIPYPLPTTADALLRYTRTSPPTAACPVATDALSLSHLTEWTIKRWTETTTALARRRYLRETFGTPPPLPPSWERRLADAFATRQLRTLS